MNEKVRYFYKISDYISENPSERVFFMMKKLFVLFLAVLFAVLTYCEFASTATAYGIIIHYF